MSRLFFLTKEHMNFLVQAQNNITIANLTN